MGRSGVLRDGSGPETANRLAETTELDPSELEEEKAAEEDADGVEDISKIEVTRARDDAQPGRHCMSAADAEDDCGKQKNEILQSVDRAFQLSPK